MDNEAERMLHALSSLRALSEIPVILCGMRKNEFIALAVLHGEPGPNAGNVPGLTASQLAHELGVSPAAVSQLISALSAKLYVERVPDARDRRVVRIRLTDKGMQAAVQVKTQMQILSERILKAMGPEDAHRFVALLTKVTQAIDHEIQDLRQCAAARVEDSVCENT